MEREDRMEGTMNGSSIVTPSGDVVAREIEGELIIVPLRAGVGDLEDELYALNDTGKAVWELLDGERTVAQVVDVLDAGFDASRDEIERDVQGLLEELRARSIVSIAG